MRDKTTASLINDVRNALPKKKSTVSKYLLAQRSVFAFFERPATKISLAFHVLSFTLIFASMVMSILSTVETIHGDDKFRNFILYFELSLLSWFSFEYVARMWSCASVSKYKGFWGRLKFARTFYMLLDAFVILSTLTTTILQMKNSYFTMLRITRFLQVFRILRVDRQRGDLMTMGRVVFKHRNQMLTCYFVGFIILLGGAYVVFIVEKSAPDPTIDNMVNGIYWAMITVTAVGYGDKSPVTWAGKIIAGLFALVGCAFFALPAGILGSGFALKVAKQKKVTRHTKLQKPAAKLIQTLWRNYAMAGNVSRFEGLEFQATWTYFFDVKCSPKNFLPGIKRLKSDPCDDIFEEESEPSPRKTRNLRSMPSWSKTSSDNESKLKMLALNNANDMVVNFSKKGSIKSVNAEVISNHHKIAARFIMKLKFWASIHSFKQYRHPFIGVEDVMEKVCRNHSMMLCQLRDINKVIGGLKAEIKELKQSMIHDDRNKPKLSSDELRETYL